MTGKVVPTPIAVYVAEAARRREGDTPLPLPPGYTLECFTPRLWRLHDPGDREAPPTILYMFWYLFSRGRYRIHYVRRGGQIVHVSHELTANPKLAFVTGSDLQIGPCRTDPAHGGQGIYIAVLRSVLHNRPNRRVWIFARENNSVSQRGILAAGFRQAGWGEKKLGIYRLTSRLVSG